MTPFQTQIAAILPAPSDFLTVGRIVGNDITLTIGPVYSTGFLIGGPVLILAGLLLIRVMYGRVKYFAMEYGYGSGWGRIKAISHFILIGSVLSLGGAAACLVGWANHGYSVTLTASGLIERQRTGTRTYSWPSLKSASERINSTDFWLAFDEGGRELRVQFQQRYLGETTQDRAIKIAEEAIRGLPPLN
ncbi:MAG: hypothetical protein JNG86_05770 [Verrucomicrobiaceae bacterium]|nr:hypothetical protein [Verrucomicrobiaceae bacterium]